MDGRPRQDGTRTPRSGRTAEPECYTAPRSGVSIDTACRGTEGACSPWSRSSAEGRMHQQFLYWMMVRCIAADAALDRWDWKGAGSSCSAQERERRVSGCGGPDDAGCGGFSVWRSGEDDTPVQGRGLRNSSSAESGSGELHSAIWGKPSDGTSATAARLVMA